MTSKRTDIHRPADFDPADYRVVDYLDVKAPVCPVAPAGVDTTVFYAAFEAYRQQWQDRIFKYFPDWRTGGTDHTSIHQCNHCGHNPIRWVAVVEHIPTGKFLAFGDICAERVEIPGRDKFRAKFIKSRAELEAAALEKKLRKATFAAANQDVLDFLAAFNNGNEFLYSVKGQLDRKGEISEAQIAAVRKFIVRQREFDARREAEAKTITASFPEGRQTVTGEIVSTKLQNSVYGETLKMLVKLTDGNKVYGTVPASLEDKTLRGDHYDENGMWVDVEPEITELRGTTITFTATFEVSKDDDHFGFFKRPTKVSVASQAVAA